MNEVKLKRVLKQLTTLANLQDKKNKNIDKRLENLNERINVITRNLLTILKITQAFEKENLTKSARIT